MLAECFVPTATGGDVGAGAGAGGDDAANRPSVRSTPPRHDHPCDFPPASLFPDPDPSAVSSSPQEGIVGLSYQYKDETGNMVHISRGKVRFQLFSVPGGSLALGFPRLLDRARWISCWDKVIYAPLRDPAGERGPLIHSQPCTLNSEPERSIPNAQAPTHS